MSREPFTYQMASDIMQRKIPFLKGNIPAGMQAIKKHVEVDLEAMEKDFPSIEYTPFKTTVSDFVSQSSPFLKGQTWESHDLGMKINQVYHFV